MAGSIPLTHPLDVAFASIAQRALVASTTMPSGLVTPEEEHLIIGSDLVPVAQADGKEAA